MNLRIGQGYDIHQLKDDLPLYLGGVKIPSSKGCIAHSDGDVLIHAIIDALLGAAAMGDIGSHFPPSEDRWKGEQSSNLLLSVIEKLNEKNWKPINIDTTIILERPKLRHHIDDMRYSLAQLLQLPIDAVSVKAKTKEKQDATGEGRSIEAHAAVLIQKN